MVNADYTLIRRVTQTQLETFLTKQRVFDDTLPLLEAQRIEITAVCGVSCRNVLIHLPQTELSVYLPGWVVQSNPVSGLQTPGLHPPVLF